MNGHFSGDIFFIKIGDRYLVSYSAGYPGTEGKTRGVVTTMWTKTLDPESPDFGYSEPELVAWAGDDEDCWAIDPAFLMGPDGRLWCSYGTYFGAIRIVELDPATGKRMPGNKAVDIAIDCEATALMYKDGWYYLLGTHGTCCDGVNSTYNIVCGRSRSVTGPYLDNMGRDMLQGGGKMVLSAGNRATGPGHFGWYVEEEGVEKMSFHYEADYNRSGRSVLAVRSLLWKNGWPVAADPFREGTYEIESERRGYSLELAVDWPSRRSRKWRTAGRPARFPSARATTCSVRTSAGPSRPCPTRAATSALRTTRSPSPAPSGPWPWTRTANSWPFRPTPAPTTNSGASNSSPTAPSAS